GPAARDQAGAVAERDARRGDPGVVRFVAGPFRDPVADVRGRRDGGARPGRAILHGVVPDPEVPAAGMRRQDPSDVRGVGSRRALGDADGAHRPAPEPDQSPGDQAEDVEMEEETTRTSTPPALAENLSRGCGYAPLNGIGPSPCRKPTT